MAHPVKKYWSLYFHFSTNTEWQTTYMHMQKTVSVLQFCELISLEVPLIHILHWHVCLIFTVIFCICIYLLIIRLTRSKIHFLAMSIVFFFNFGNRSGPAVKENKMFHIMFIELAAFKSFIVV